jgi:hypothetical protein
MRWASLTARWATASRRSYGSSAEDDAFLCYRGASPLDPHTPARPIPPLPQKLEANDRAG